MPVKTIEKVIDGHDVKIVQFNAVRGIKLKARLYKVLLPIFGPLIPSLTNAMRSGKKELSFADLDLDIEGMLPKAIQTLAEQLDEEKFYKLMLDLMSSTFVSNRQVDEQFFDDLFIGNYFMIYKIVTQIVIANRFFALGDFGKIPGIVPNVASQEKSGQS